MYAHSLDILKEENHQEALVAIRRLLGIVRCTRGELGGETSAVKLIQTVEEKFKAQMEPHKEREGFNAENTRDFLTIIKWNVEAATSRLILGLTGVVEKAPDRALRCHSIRRATLDDLQDLALVCMGGFSYSPVFNMQRPNYAEFPGHTLC